MGELRRCDAVTIAGAVAVAVAVGAVLAFDREDMRPWSDEAFELRSDALLLGATEVEVEVKSVAAAAAAAEDAAAAAAAADFCFCFSLCLLCFDECE